MDFKKTHVVLNTSTCIRVKFEDELENTSNLSHVEVRIESRVGSMTVSVVRFTKDDMEFGNIKKFPYTTSTISIFRYLKEISVHCKNNGVPFAEVLELITEVEDRFNTLIR